jgi:hypothetical protein
MTIAGGIELPDAEIAEVCRRHRIRQLALCGSVLTGRFSASLSGASRIPEAAAD